MARVKASKQHRLIVVRHRPVLTLLIRTVLLIAIVGGCVGGYSLGYRNGAALQTQLTQSLTTQKQQSKVLALERSELSQQLINTKTGAEVDRQASESIRQELLTLKGKLQKTQEENNFYRNIMNPPKGQKGPAIGVWQTSPNGIANQYDFKLVIKQLAKHSRWIKGHVEIMISGKNADNQVIEHNYKTLAVLGAKAANTGEQAELRVRFRYFQTLTGTLQLPQHFTPQQVTIRLVVEGKKTQTITQNYDW